MIDENTLRLFALTLWAVGMFFFVVWAFWKGEIERFLETRRYKREQKYFLSQNYMDFLAEYQKREHDSRLDRNDIDKGAE